MTRSDHPIPATMVAPGDRRPGAYRGGIIQIHVTRACDMACFGCTQASNLGGRTAFITVEQFDEACRSLEGYFGVVGVFGGNPCLHPRFPELCRVLRERFPREQRGLWSNNLNGHGAVCRETFDPRKSNLNVHLNRTAYDEMKRDWPECRPVGLEQDSRHSPPFVALHDVVADEAERWRLIGQCDVNQHWSAMVCVVRGRVRGFFCEIAGAQAMLHQHEPGYPDTGVEASPGWWRRPIGDFEDQIRFHCHRCGIPLRTFGELAIGGEREQTSREHAAVFKPKRPGRLVQIVAGESELSRDDRLPVTTYIGKAK